jgi:hypothetical protein
MDDLDECYFIEATDWCYWCVNENKVERVKRE